MIAIIRVRSSPRMSADDEFALQVLHLPVPNSCVLLDDTPHVRGMIHRSAGVLTWGDVSAETITLLRKKAKDAKALVFRLNPPRGGYGRKGVKMPFSKGGALGNRAAKIDDLIKRMVA